MKATAKEGSTMRRVTIALAFAIVFGACWMAWRVSADTSGIPPTLGIPPEVVAGYIHDVIEADRTAYTVHVVERMQLMGVVVAAENWHERPVLPLPAQLLLEASQMAAVKQHSVRYRLMSLWPINPKNGPTNDFERHGLESVRAAPEHPYTGIQSYPGGRYFEAIYADRAVTQACIGCHNAHPRSPRHDFKRTDVMGGIIIRIPLAK
jgi:hypothetical protein